MAENNNLQIRNSTVDFLVFTKDAQEDGIEVRVQDHDVWLTQKAIGQLFDVDRSVVTKHLKNVFESGELSETSTCANFAQVADNGKTYQYNSSLWLPLLLADMCVVFGKDDAKHQADVEAIPESPRHNLVKAGVRNVG